MRKGKNIEMKRYISDLHLGHKNVIAFDQRPFCDLKDMEQAIITNWNKVVTKNDDVYVLGDFFWNNEDATRVLPLLKGNIHLILGNHDRMNGQMKKYFASVSSYDEIKDNGRHVVLCHYPIAHWRNADYGNIHLYGHIHQGRDNRPFEDYITTMKQRDIPYKCYNVGCMLPYMSYTPRTLDEIITANS